MASKPYSLKTKAYTDRLKELMENFQATGHVNLIS